MAFQRRGRTRVEKDDSDSAPSLSPERQETRARNVLLYQLGRSAKSKDQCRKILAKRGIDSEIAERILDRFEEAQIIDDVTFARLFTSSRIKTKGLAKSAIARELRDKGIDQLLIEDTLVELDSESETARAIELAINRVRRMNGLDTQVIKRRLAGYLGRKGYSGSIVGTATRAALDEQVKSEV
jgi:regulatory protein